MLLREKWLGIPAWKPKTLGAFCPRATVWKCLSVQMEKVASLWRESPWVHLELFQRMRCTKSLCDQEKTTPGSSQEMKGFLQMIVQNAPALNFSSPEHPAPLTGMGVWRDYPTRMELFLFITCFPPSFQTPFCLCNSKVSVSNPILVFSIQDSHCHETAWPSSQGARSRSAFTAALKAKCCGRASPGCTSPGPYPHLPHTTGLKTPNNDLIRLELLLEPIFCTKVVSALFLNNFWQILFFSFVMKTQSSKPGLTETWQTNSASVLNYHYP